MTRVMIAWLSLATILLFDCCPIDAGESGVRRREPVKQYRFIYNRDGCASYGKFDGDAEKWVEHEFSRLEGSAVDLVAWCFDGGNTAEYDSDILKNPGDADLEDGYDLPDRDLNQTSFRRAYDALKKMIKEGNDPPNVIIKAARDRGMDIFVSYRMNDTHDSKGTFKNPKLPNPEFADFKREHPEWLIGDMTYKTKYGNYFIHRGWSGLNFAVPEVRELKLAVIKEYFDKYDFDGIELDLTTQTPYFRPSYGYRNQYLMSDFLRSVRRALDRRGDERGRPIVVAAHVFESPIENELYGFDIKNWVQEGLIDMLTIGRGNQQMDLEAFHQIVDGSHVRIYPCVYRPDEGYDVARGWASVYWQQGVDGLYSFNWGYTDPPGQAETIRDISDPTVLMHRDKTFRLEPGVHNPVYWKLHALLFNMLPVELHPTHSETPLVLPLRIGDDLAKQKEMVQDLRLQIQLQNASGRDEVHVFVNGNDLGPGDWDGGSLAYRPDPAVFVPGENHVAIRLVQRDSQASSKKPIVIETLDLVVDYRDP